VIRRTIEDAAAQSFPQPVLSSLARVLEDDYGTTLESTYFHFALANFFTGSRDDGRHYREGAAFPEARIAFEMGCRFPVLTLPKWISPLGCAYARFVGDGVSSGVRVRVSLGAGPPWRVGWVAFRGGSYTVDSLDVPFASGPVTLEWTDWSRWDSVIVVVANLDRTFRGGLISLEADRRDSIPSLEPGALLVLDRSDCRRPFDGVGDGFDRIVTPAWALARELAATGRPVVLADRLPQDLSSFDALFVAETGWTGPALADSEMAALVEWVDRGGPLYLEAPRLGEWIDPAIGAPDSVQERFWNLFGVRFVPGEVDSVGNLDRWSTRSGWTAGSMAFRYDHRSPADDRVGVLEPSPSDSFVQAFVEDGSGRVRGVWRAVPGKGPVAMATPLLGASVPEGGATRTDYLEAVLLRFGLGTPPTSWIVRGPYPNPASGPFRMWLSGPASAEMTLALFDPAGRRVWRRRFSWSGGSGEVTFDAPDLPSGIYFLRLDGRRLRSTRKLWVIR
jgi:hypothetical protein